MQLDPKTILMAQRARAAYAEFTQPSRERPAWLAGKIEELRIATSAGDTRVLVYKPKQTEGVDLPVFVDIHGGGFIQGSAEDDDEWCRKIVEAVGCAVVNIDYHLAPEYPFPVALEECYDIVKWAQRQGSLMGFDAERIAVGGHSAGGNLTAAICLLARQRREFSVVYQVLNYPPLDFTIDPLQKPARDTMLTPRVQEFFTTCYLGLHGDPSDPLASPLRAQTLRGLPAALIISAEYDPLCGENKLYAERLTADGVEVTYKMYPGCMHAFTHFGHEPAASQAWALIHEKLKQAFAFRHGSCSGGTEANELS